MKPIRFPAKSCESQAACALQGILSLPRFRGHQVWRGCSPGGLHGQDSQDIEEAAEDGAVEMVPQAHKAHVNITHGLRRIIARAGLKRRPRLLQNLRASCSTDWAEALPAHVFARWLGHSPLVAAKHYLQTRDAHFQVAIRCIPRVGEAEAQAAPSGQRPEREGVSVPMTR